MDGEENGPMTTSSISVLERKQALKAFIHALAAMDRAERGDSLAMEDAIFRLHVCLEWVTSQTWPDLWVEAQIALADAYANRQRGDPLANARLAIAGYRAALCASLDCPYLRGPREALEGDD